MVRRRVGMQFNSSGRMRSFDPALSHIHRCSAAAGSEGGATRRAVLRMLQGGALADAASVIVYCTYQAQVRKVQVQSQLGFLLSVSPGFWCNSETATRLGSWLTTLLSGAVLRPGGIPVHPWRRRRRLPRRQAHAGASSLQQWAVSSMAAERSLQFLISRRTAASGRFISVHTAGTR